MKKLVVALTAIGLGFILYQGTRDLETSLSISDQLVNRWLGYVLDDPTLSSEAYFTYYPLANYYIRKLAHLLEYATFGCLLAYLFKASRFGIRDLIVHSLFGVVLIALLDEYLQKFIGRGSLVSDVWLDFWGGCFGVSLFLILSGLRHFFRQFKSTKKFR